MPKDDLENDVEIELPAKEAEPKEVEVDLDSPKPDETKPVAKEPQKAEPSDELAKLHKRMEYQARQFERSTKQVQQLSEELKALREATTSRDQKRVISDNDLDPEIQALAETNWQKAVDKLAEKKAEAVVERKLKEAELKSAEASKKQAEVSEWERSKVKVLDRYPSLNDEATEDSRLFREVYNEDSTLYSNIHGPEIAMYRMEEKMRQSGRTPAPMKALVDREATRVARATGSSIVGRTPTNGNKIRLTSEQVNFCKEHGISQESYAKSLAQLNAREGVEA